VLVACSDQNTYLDERLRPSAGPLYFVHVCHRRGPAALPAAKNGPAVRTSDKSRDFKCDSDGSSELYGEPTDLFLFFFRHISKEKTGSM
jgi:hypothetical protein